LDTGAPTLQEGDVELRDATRSSIQLCTSSDNHATLQAPSLIRCGKALGIDVPPTLLVRADELIE
jgi:hypothetical protein